MIDEAQKALEEAEALKKVIPLLPLSFVVQIKHDYSISCFIHNTASWWQYILFIENLPHNIAVFSPLFVQLGARQEPVLESSKYSAADVRIVSSVVSEKSIWYTLCSMSFSFNIIENFDY